MNGESKPRRKFAWGVHCWKLWGFFCITLFLLTLFLLPYPIGKDPEKISGIRMEYQGETINSFDEIAVKDLLSKVWCRRSFNNCNNASVGWVEINFIYEERPIHIVLGEENFCYHSADDFQIGIIINPESVRLQFEKLLQDDLVKTG